MNRSPLATDAAGAALAAGAVLLLPTDTICGLHARADCAPALARIIAIKGRPGGQPLLVLAASLAQAEQLCAPLTRHQKAQCATAWPGPFTFILPARPELPEDISDRARGTIAIRVPGRADLRRLIERAGGPVASTSANRSGEPANARLEEALAVLGDVVDGWWAGEPEPAAPVPGPLAGGAAGTGSDRPSALIDLTIEPPRVLRAGPLPLPLPARLS